jgi:HEAT repeat protein
MISEFIFYTEDASKEDKYSYIDQKIHIRELLNDDFNRKVLSSILLDLRKDVSGVTQKKLIELYKNLGLHNDAYKKLKSWRWEVVAQGILELTQMQVTEAYQVIVGFLNDKRSIVRKQAEIATIMLKNEGIAYYLDTTKHKISEWQQLSLLDVLRTKEGFEPPKFKAWLTSKNKYVVLFALRLIKHYNQNDAKASLIELVKHRNNQIKEEAIGCLKVFNVVEALDTLKLVFWKSSTDVKISILGAIAALGNEDDITFLKQIEKKRLDFSVKSKAISAINTILPESILPTEGIESTLNIKAPEDIIEPDPAPMEENEEDSEVNYQEEVPLEISHQEFDILPLLEETDVQERPFQDEPNINTFDVIYETVDFLPREVAKESNDRENKEEINNLDISYEVVPSNDEKSNGKDQRNSPSTDIELEELSFLPIVVVEQDKENEPTLAVNDMDVDYEEVLTVNEGEYNEKEEDLKTFGLSAGDLDFLPIVIDKDTNSIIESQEEDFQKNLNEFEVAYEEVMSVSEKMVIEEVLDNNLSESITASQDEEFQKELNEIEVSYDEVMSVPEKMVIEEVLDSKLDEEESPSLNVDRIKVVYEELQAEEIENVKPDEYIDWIDMQDHIKDPLNDESEIEIESILSLIPKSFKFDKKTAALISLLADIEAFGDHREIPYLTDLLLEESRPLLRERIQDVIYGIEKSSDYKEGKVRHSIFQELFVSCDTESKLILMDEMLAIGDEKEVSFLTELMNDQHIKISTKAEAILTELKERLTNEALNEMHVDAFVLSEAHDIQESANLDSGGLLVFTDEFILQPPKDPRKSLDSTSGIQPVTDSGFFGQLKSIQHKFRNK